MLVNYNIDRFDKIGGVWPANIQGEYHF